VVRIHVSHGNSGETPATITTATSTTWQTPVQVGRDTRGEAVTFATFEHNTLVASRPGSGKTGLSRIMLAHYLLDPTTAVYLLDGKGSIEDYGTCRSLCTRFVSGTDDNAVTDTATMRNEVSPWSGHATQPVASTLVSWSSSKSAKTFRAAADRAERDRLDSTLGRIVRMGGALAVHVIVSTQRPTVDDLPAGTRNLLSQRVALMLRNSADAGLVLGAAPTLSLPTRRGQALYTDGGLVRGVLLDRLTDDAWTAVCARAAALRPTAATVQPNYTWGTLPAAVRAPVVTAPVDPVDPLIGEVLRLTS
jgi:hypothetical protein